MRKIAAIIMLTVAALHARAEGNGHTAFSSLDIPASAHAAALGGNISVVEDDASLALYNPALLSSVSHRTLSLGYLNYMSGVAAYNAQYTHVADEKTTVGGSIRYVDFGKMKQMDAMGVDEGDFAAADITFQGLLSYTLAKDLVGGISAKFVYSKIGSYTSTAAAVDLGINYYNPDHDLSLSAAVRNLGGQLSAYNDEYESIPLDVALGATWKPDNFPFRFSLTLSDLNHWDYSFVRHANIGVDLILSPQFYVAGGYSLQREHTMKVTATDGTESSHGAGLSVGAGLMLDKFKLNIAYGKYHVSASSLMLNMAFGI